MNFLIPIASGTILSLGALLGVLLVVAYILKMKRRQFEVPFSMLWQRVLKEKEARSLWRHLKRLLSLLLLIVMVGLLLVAALEPELGGKSADARSVIVVIDTSASMKTVDETSESGDPQERLEAAKRSVLTLLDGMGADDSVMLMRMDGRATPLSRFQSDIPKLKALVGKIQASDTPADLQSTLSTAADALRFRQNPVIVIVGDGAYSEESLASVIWEPDAKAPITETSASRFKNQRLSVVDLSGIDVRYQAIGQKTANAGIVAFNVRRYISNRLNYEVYIEIQNFSDEAVKRKLVLYNGDTEIDVKEISIAAGEKLTKIYPNLGGGEARTLRARIESMSSGENDAFPLDDEAWALIPENKRQKILLVSEDNLYMEGALLVFEHLDVDKLTPTEYEAALAQTQLLAYDAAIFHEYTPEKLPPESTHLLYFAPDGEHSPFKNGKPLARGRITRVSPTHPIMRWIEMDDVNFDSLGTFSVDRSTGEVSLGQSLRATIGAAKKEGRRKIAAFGFSMTGTDLMLRVSFPLLMVNTLDWFAGADSDLITTYTTGRRARVPLDGTYGISEVEVITPSGKHHQAPLSEGYATFFANEVGIHKLIAKQDGTEVATIQLASNLSNPNESDIEPSSELILGGQTVQEPEPGVTGYRQSLWVFLVLLVLLLVLVEWYTFNRRITV